MEYTSLVYLESMTQPNPTIWEHLNDERPDIEYTTQSMLQVVLASTRPDHTIGGVTYSEEEVQKYKALDRKVEDFNSLVFEPRLFQQIEDEPNIRGMVWQSFEGLKVTTYVLAGRTMVTLSKDDHDVTVLAAEGEIPSRMGLHGITGSFNQAIALFDEAIRLKDTITLEASSDITLG